MKRALPLALVLAASTAFAQAPVSGINGKIDIDFKARTNPEAGVKNVYTLDLRAADTVIFGGKISHLPTIFSSMLGRETQGATLEYNLNMAVANPANLSQVRQVGKLVGAVPINRNGTYEYDKGSLRAAVDAMGKAPGFTSAYRGAAAGKPPKDESKLAAAKKDAIKLTKQVQGKSVSIVVSDYDKMGFSGLVLAAGPAANYPETTVNGDFLYDYERSAWYFQNVIMTYVVDGKTTTDKISGNIKWVESPAYKTNGEGEYQFDVRVNEPEKKATEEAAFAATDDESAFFETDMTIPSLGGTMKYKDQFSGDVVRSSAVTVAITNNNLSKTQVVNLAKLILIASVVPMNSD